MSGVRRPGPGPGRFWLVAFGFAKKKKTPNYVLCVYACVGQTRSVLARSCDWSCCLLRPALALRSILATSVRRYMERLNARALDEQHGRPPLHFKYEPENTPCSCQVASGAPGASGASGVGSGEARQEKSYTSGPQVRMKLFRDEILSYDWGEEENVEPATCRGGLRVTELPSAKIYRTSTNVHIATVGSSRKF